jgi:hypothetical protein
MQKKEKSTKSVPPIGNWMTLLRKCKGDEQRRGASLVAKPIILAIDPGNVMSAYCLMDGEYKPLDKGKVNNADLLAYIEEHAEGIDVLVVEMIASYGMPVGAEVFETCVMIGMIEHLADTLKIPHERVFRKDEKMYICLDSRAKDSNIRHALIDRFAVHDKQRGTGTKACPDTFYGFAADIWAAFAVGVVYLDREREKALKTALNG